MTKKLKIAMIFALALCVMISVLMLVACNRENEHTHTFGAAQRTPATCETAGSKTRTCTICGYEETEPIPALGHKWQEVTELKPATCEEDGLRSAVCSRCNASEDEQIVPALGHDWKIETIQSETCQQGGQYLHTCQRQDCNTTKTVTTSPVDHKWNSGVTVAATCESDGRVTYTCTFNCGTQKVDTIKAYGHQWSSWQTVTFATCSTVGTERRVCMRSNCNGSETRDIAKLEHIWSSDYIIDKKPSLEEEGSKSKHCTRSGCDAKSDVQTIPMLDANTLIDYTVTITDPCGVAYKGTATIEFAADGMQTQQVTMTTGGVTNVTLGAANYKVRLIDLKAGYSTALEEYDLRADEPQLTIHLNTAMIEEEKPSLPFYKEGSVLYNQEYVYFGPNDELITTTLKEILSTKKGIIMNFYFNLCPPCNSEMSALIATSWNYQSDIQIIMVNQYETDAEIKAFRTRNNAENTPLMFLNAESTRYTFKDFASVVKYFPTSAFIDCNGQVVAMHVNAMTQSGFSSAINNYILNRYAILRPSTEAATIDTTIAILPSKKFD